MITELFQHVFTLMCWQKFLENTVHFLCLLGLITCCQKYNNLKNWICSVINWKKSIVTIVTWIVVVCVLSYSVTFLLSAITLCYFRPCSSNLNRCRSFKIYIINRITIIVIITTSSRVKPCDGIPLPRLPLWWHSVAVWGSILL